LEVLGRWLIAAKTFEDADGDELRRVLGVHLCSRRIGGLGPADAVNIWRGVLITAEQAFQPDDDVCKLLRILAKVPGLLDGSPGSRWPVGRLVTILNAEFSPPPWSHDRVENAKKRLLNWVQRLMRQNGLDATDLEAVFARVARQKVQQRMPVMESSERNLQS
jgi:hypothetical protein